MHFFLSNLVLDFYNNFRLTIQGGPLMHSKDNKWTLTGIVSFGPIPCGRDRFDGAPAVFTRISSYLPWIKSVTDQDKVSVNE